MRVDADRDRGASALRAAGVSLGVLGATVGGVSGWFTLAPQDTVATAAVSSTRTDPSADSPADARVGLGTGPAHTRTGA